ncbi:unnamed protein product [Sphenostylis stenocarpa]|uniref:Uncharacterized protein n=1 Tax=Sphenostylis stenocarpa TaxID=92480 RepID=A0AA86VPB5_9FABA|nr:unnamed protein product [Sphenostylis stenocarpa]
MEIKKSASTEGKEQRHDEIERNSHIDLMYHMKKITDFCQQPSLFVEKYPVTKWITPLAKLVGNVKAIQQEEKLREARCKGKIRMGDLMQRIMEMIQAEQAAKGSNNGTSNSFNNHASGRQDFGGATINSGQHAGDRSRYDFSAHYDEQVLNNTGTFNGNGNGGSIKGGFDASTRNYYGRRY